MFFGRNEIHIQAFAKIPPANLMSGDSSSSTFHHFIILSYYNYQKFRSSKFQIFKFRNFKSSNFEISKSQSQVHRTFRKFWDSQILRSQKSIFSKDVPVFFLVFFEVNSWQIEGSRVHYGSQNFRNFGSSQNRQKSIEIDQESTFSHFGIIKTP